MQVPGPFEYERATTVDQAIGLMERLGMVHCPNLDFAHPHFPPDHPLSRHVTYVIARP